MKTKRWEYGTGDGKTFEAIAEACEHAERVHQKSGVFLSIAIADTLKAERVKP